jgi:hypothetical protein
MSEKCKSQAAPSHVCPACWEAFDTPDKTVSFDCGHVACLSCVTEGLRVLRKSSNAGSPGSAPTVQPLACFLSPDSCNGVLFWAQTRAVLRRIQLRPAATTVPVEEQPSPYAAAPCTPDADAVTADIPPPAANADVLDFG